MYWAHNAFSYAFHFVHSVCMLATFENGRTGQEKEDLCLTVLIDSSLTSACVNSSEYRIQHPLKTQGNTVFLFYNINYRFRQCQIPGLLGLQMSDSPRHFRFAYNYFVFYDKNPRGQIT